jgi:hypothetical protein
MLVSRLTRCVDIVRLWPFFIDGFQFVGRYRKYSLDLTAYRHTLQNLVKTPNAWVGVTKTDDDEPLAFWCAQEITPKWAKEREFEVFLRFHKRHQLEATLAVQKQFEQWCVEENVKRYFMTARRDDSKGPRRFPADSYGMKKAYSVYKKEL